MRKLFLMLIILGVGACGRSADETPQPAADATPASVDEAVEAVEEAVSAASEQLSAILADQPEDVRDRYRYRHPQETLEFFGVEPGMTVVEALPGGGWYSKILIPYLGEDGRLIGADYAIDMYRRFPFANDEFMEAKQTWTTDWPEMASAWHEGGATIDAFHFGALPERLHGTADAVLFIRALHNLARFEADGGYLSQAVQDAYAVLKPGGIVGVVQHHARDEMPDEWAGGQAGYLKQGRVVAAMEAAGFEFVEASDINANPADQPTADDVVWRLPPSLGTSQDNPELRAELEAVGESNRMTLKFRKPAM